MLLSDSTTGKNTPHDELDYIFSRADTDRGLIEVEEYNALLQELDLAANKRCCNRVFLCKSNHKCEFTVEEFQVAVDVLYGITPSTATIAADDEGQTTARKGMNKLQMWDVLYNHDRVHVINDAQLLKRGTQMRDAVASYVAPDEPNNDDTIVAAPTQTAPTPDYVEPGLIAQLTGRAPSRGKQGARERILARKRALEHFHSAKSKLAAVHRLKMMP